MRVFTKKKTILQFIAFLYLIWEPAIFVSLVTKLHSPVPELSFLPAPYRGWTRPGEIWVSSFTRPGSAPIWGGKKGEFRDWTKSYKAVTGAISSPEFSHLDYSEADLPGKILGSKVWQMLINSLKAGDVTTFEVTTLFLTAQVESDTPVHLRLLFGDRSRILLFLSFSRCEWTEVRFW